MKTRPMLITRPNSPRLMLDTMLDTDYAFTPGRRNDDIVNWFLLIRMLELEGEVELVPARKDHEYVTLFTVEVLPKLSKDQRHYLDTWDEKVEDKLYTLYAYYHGITDAEQLRNLWLPQDYEVPQP